MLNLALFRCVKISIRKFIFAVNLISTMFKKKTILALLAILLLVAVLGYEQYLKVAEENNVVSAGSIPKETTNTYFLPTSTTGQIVHHANYSLSYS